MHVNEEIRPEALTEERINRRSLTSVIAAGAGGGTFPNPGSKTPEQITRDLDPVESAPKASGGRVLSA
jgi:hypothetical protein